MSKGGTRPTVDPVPQGPPHTSYESYPTPLGLKVALRSQRAGDGEVLEEKPADASENLPLGFRGHALPSTLEGGSGWGTHVNPRLIHVNAWQKPVQYCKVISLHPAKINLKKDRQYMTINTVPLCKVIVIWRRGTSGFGSHSGGEELAMAPCCPTA